MGLKERFSGKRSLSETVREFDNEAVERYVEKGEVYGLTLYGAKIIAERYPAYTVNVFLDFLNSLVEDIYLYQEGFLPKEDNSELLETLEIIADFYKYRGDEFSVYMKKNHNWEAILSAAFKCCDGTSFDKIEWILAEVFHVCENEMCAFIELLMDKKFNTKESFSLDEVDSATRLLSSRFVYCYLLETKPSVIEVLS